MRTRALALAAALPVMALAASAAGAEPPRRVVSLNVCTDQLAMLLAAPGQIAAVSTLAREPQSSAMAAEAMAYPVTRGGAEEVFLMRPDLVLAGTYTTRATVDLLRRMGVRVEVLPPPQSLADVGAQILAVGAALGRETEAQRMARQFEDDLAALGSEGPDRPRAALYFANGYTVGGGTLSGEVLAAAGFANVADEAGVTRGGRLPLELLLVAAPDLVVPGTTYAGASRAEEILRHPALSGLRFGRAVADADWVCGTPYVLRAVRALIAEREALPR